MTKRPRRKPAKKSGGKVAPKPKPDGRLITRHALARATGIQASLVRYHMAKEGAPKLDQHGRGNREEMERWVREGMAWSAQAQTTATKGMKERLLALELEEKEAAAGLRRGDLIKLKDVSDSISAVWVQHEALLRQKFEHELPHQYQGKNEAERRVLNVQALLEIAKAFRSGQTRIETQATQTPP